MVYGACLTFLLVRIPSQLDYIQGYREEDIYMLHHMTQEYPSLEGSYGFLRHP